MAVRKTGKVYYGQNLDDLQFDFAIYRSDNRSDRINAGEGPNALWGKGGNDKLYGRGGDDLLFGGAGNDILIGGKGADYFVFETAPGSDNVDTVKDFSRKQGDKIVLSSALFPAVNLVFKDGIIPETDFRLDAKIGHLSEAEFRLGAAATQETDRIVYDQATGALWYDKDGSGAEAAVQIATFKTKPALGVSDFLFY